ncbi:MAG: hypothetical protein WCR67_06315, partial [Bacilli bacterium]
MNFKKITLALLPLLMLTSCGTTSTAGSDAPSTSTSDTSTVAKTYAITATNGEGYTIDNLSATTATRGETITFKVTVTDTAKIIQSVKYNTTELTANENGVYSFTMPSREVSITVTLRDKPVTYAITASTSDDYSITDLSATNSVAGSEITFKVTVNSSDKSIKSVKANSVSCVKKGELYSFTMPAEAVTIAVELSSSYAITAESGEGYTITDLSEAKAYAGKSISFKVTVTDSMKDIDTVKANGTDCTAIGAGVYSFVMPEAAVTVAVTLKASNLGLDISHMQTGYIINELVPEQSDVFDSTGIKIYTADANGSPVELTTEQYATVEYSSVDIEDLTKPIESTGVKTILVTFGEYSRSFTIAVGTYTVKNVELIAADLEANIKVTCQYTGISELQFKAFNWGMDLQHNNNIDGQGWGTILDTDNEGTSIDFAYGEDNTVGFSLDITKLDNGAYTTHFGHKTVENSNGGQQKMDLLFPKGVNQRITVGDKAYMVQFGAFWGKGDCDITVADKGASYDKVKRVLTNVALTKADNKPVMTIEGTYDAYFNEELTEADIKPAFDMQEINAWTTFTYDSLNPVFTFDAEAKTFKLVIELTQCISEDNIYYFHIAGANL